MDDDLNVSKAWGAVFDWVRDTNRKLAANELSNAQAASLLASWQTVNGVLGVGAPAEDSVDPALESLLEERQAARKSRNFARADAIRDELKAQGWTIEDTPKGPKLKKL